MHFPDCRSVSLRTVILLLALLAAPCEDRAVTQTPADLDAFIAQTRAALDSGKADSALAAPPPEALLWRGNPKRWHLNVLPLPGAKGLGERVAVFSRFHAPQFDGDSVFRLVHTPDGW